MNIFKRKKEKHDITVEQRAMENKRAVQRLIDELAKSGNGNMDHWQDEIRGLRNG